jgi:hypothetical protein
VTIYTDILDELRAIRADTAAMRKIVEEIRDKPISGARFRARVRTARVDRSDVDE